MFWQKKPKSPPETPREIEKVGYKVAADGSVVCATCGTYCGQCGGDHSADSVDAFFKKMNRRKTR